MSVVTILAGSPWFDAQKSMKLHVTESEFYLSPPAEIIDSSEDNDKSVQFTFRDDAAFRRKFSQADHIFGQTLDEVCSCFKQVDFRSILEDCRHKVYIDFLSNSNGCYFNNKKYGIEKIFRFSRTEDIAEQPVLELNLFTTDYFTHRIMKAVCKRLISEEHFVFKNLRETGVPEEERIFYTSLGINILLEEQDPDGSILLTQRSMNAANADLVRSISVSVTEGVALHDYSHEKGLVDLEYAALRGLNEELGIEQDQIDLNSLQYYDLVLNTENLEIGVVGSVRLREGLSLQNDILNRVGSDEGLEVAGKIILPKKEVLTFMNVHNKEMLSVLHHALQKYLARNAALVPEPIHDQRVLPDESFCIGKDGVSSENGDHIYNGEHFKAVFDGATPKGERLWDGIPGDVYVSSLLAEAMKHVDPCADAGRVITYLNDVIRESYAAHNVSFDALPPEERLQASIVVYSKYRSEVWCFGDCSLKINHNFYKHTRPGDKLLSDLRAFWTQLCLMKQKPPKDDDPGREAILPFLREFPTLANQPGEYGYDVINGGKICPENVIVYPVNKGDRIILSSDGYPALLDTLAETEDHLFRMLEKDPMCINELRGTKGVKKGNQSFDDRSYISFYAD